MREIKLDTWCVGGGAIACVCACVIRAFLLTDRRCERKNSAVH